VDANLRARRALVRGALAPLLTFQQAVAWLDGARADVDVRESGGLVSIEIALGPRRARARVFVPDFHETLALLATGLRDELGVEEE
jgi:hypothetical protein